MVSWKQQAHQLWCSPRDDDGVSGSDSHQRCKQYSNTVIITCDERMTDERQLQTLTLTLSLDVGDRQMG